jgi:hypothetical protein
MSTVVSEERYVQTETVPDTKSPLNVTRVLRSDLLLQTDEHFGWVTFRDVFEVDGRPVHDRDDRVANLFASSNPDAWRQARLIADESARFNLDVPGVSQGRTLNVPMTALLFFRAADQHRSKFKVERDDTVDGRRVAVVSFEEQSQPRLIRSPGNIAMSGEAWIEPGSGRVLRTTLAYTIGDQLGLSTAVQIVVLYGDAGRLGVWVPVSMDENYRTIQFRRLAPAIPVPMFSARATYSNFRRFNIDVSQATHQQ